MSKIVMKQKDCGKHWGATAGPCRKCAHFARQEREWDAKGYGISMRSAQVFASMIGHAVASPPPHPRH